MDNTYLKNGIVLTRTLPDDPAFVLLLDDFTTTPDKSMEDEHCYICIDPEYARMGFPLCYACPKCGKHVAADEGECLQCGWVGGYGDMEDE